MSDDDYVTHAVRRRMGFDALRRIRRFVDAEAAQEQTQARLARRLAWIFGLAALAAVLLLAIR